MANVEIPEGLEELFQQTWFDHFLHYGLLAGAIFQLICIAAIVVCPQTSEEEAEQENGGPVSRSGLGVPSSEGAKEMPGAGAGGGANVAGGVVKRKKMKKRK